MIYGISDAGFKAAWEVLCKEGGATDGHSGAGTLQRALEAYEKARSKDFTDVVDDFFVEIMKEAERQDIAENGPNPEGIWRSLSHRTLTMNELLLLKGRFLRDRSTPT